MFIRNTSVEITFFTSIFVELCRQVEWFCLWILGKYVKLAKKMAYCSQLSLSLTLLQTNNAILSTIQTGHQSNVGNLNITSKTSTAFKHLPQRYFLYFFLVFSVKSKRWKGKSEETRVLFQTMFELFTTWPHEFANWNSDLLSNQN